MSVLTKRGRKQLFIALGVLIVFTLIFALAGALG